MRVLPTQVIASDGLWEFMSSSTVAQIVNETAKQEIINEIINDEDQPNGVSRVCNRLVKEARALWEQNNQQARSTYFDDITIIIVQIGPSRIR